MLYNYKKMSRIAKRKINNVLQRTHSLKYLFFGVFIINIFILGYCVSDLMHNKHRKHVLQVTDTMDNVIPQTPSSNASLLQQETILYVSSEIQDKKSNALHRLGVRLFTCNNKPDYLFVQTCDSINHVCYDYPIDLKMIEKQRIEQEGAFLRDLLDSSLDEKTTQE